MRTLKDLIFSTSITDFWHRWHITLGTWMKDYVFYPLTLSKGMVKFRKAAKKKLGKKISVKLPICVSNLIVFFLVGCMAWCCMEIHCIWNV